MKIAGLQRCRCLAARAEIALALFLILTLGPPPRRTYLSDREKRDRCRNG